MRPPVISFHVSFVFFLFLILCRPAAGQESSAESPWDFLPRGGPLLQLPANPEEPRTGIRMELGSSRMRLDVGADLDLIELTCSPHDRLRMGFLIFAYALTTNNQGLRLQIDALDGFFGGHITYRRESDIDLCVRLRILHRSAHFVDGHLDPNTGTWVDGQAPIPFTLDFGELVLAGEGQLAPCRVNIYSGISYATLVRPTTIQRIGLLFGIDCRLNDTWTTVFGHPFVPYAAYQLRLTGIPEYTGSHVVEVGTKFGGWEERGVRLFTAYNAGLEVFGQYYDVRRKFWSAGFSFDIF